MGSQNTTRAPKPTVAPRATGGITGPGKVNVDKLYRQMDESKPLQMKPPTIKPSVPSRPPTTSGGMTPTTPGGMKPKKNRSAFEDNRMQ